MPDWKLYGFMNMALIKCTECHREISDKAKQCPFCGCPQSKSKNKKTIITAVAVIAVLVVTGGYMYNAHHKAEVKKAIESYNNYLASMVAEQSYPKKPQSYYDLERISQQFKPTNPGCQLALYDALHTDRRNFVPFKETKIYKDWDNNYKYNFEKLY